MAVGLALLAPFLLAQSAMDGPPQSVAAMREGSVPRSGMPAVRTFEAPSRLQACLNAATDDPDSATATATTWLKEEKGSHQAEPYLCLGSAYSTGQNWAEAEKSFVAGREIAGTSDHLLRARLGAMAGNAALAGSELDRALTLLDTAHADAQAANDPHLAGDIAIDRARALVALKRDGDAAGALAEARLASPDNAYGWLLSATLSRRMGQLPAAQTQIETAAQLAPLDPEIGLEGGVIAVLAGHNDAAAKSWRSVIAASPDSPQATSARKYLDQLGRLPGSATPAPAQAPTGTPR